MVSRARFDVPSLLRGARERAGLSQEQLVARAGTSRGAVSAYETGTRSPTARTLQGLLAAAGLQLRVALEPLLADLDERVDAMVRERPEIHLPSLVPLAASLAEERRWDAADPEDLDAEPVWETGHPRWAFDGATALALQGLRADDGELAIAMVWEPATRWWLSGTWVRGYGPSGAVGWWTADLEDARYALAHGAVGRLGPLRVRLVDALPPVLRLRPEGCDEVVPVVTVDEVERSFPAYAEVLGRWRERRAG